MPIGQSKRVSFSPFSFVYIILVLHLLNSIIDSPANVACKFRSGVLSRLPGPADSHGFWEDSFMNVAFPTYAHLSLFIYLVKRNPQQQYLCKVSVVFATFTKFNSLFIHGIYFCFVFVRTCLKKTKLFKNPKAESPRNKNCI